MNRPLIVMALEEEGQGLLQERGFDIVICGVGKVNAAYHLTRALYDGRRNDKAYPLVLNMGSAGSRSFARGTLVAAHQFAQRDMDVTGLGFTLGHTPFENDPPVITFPKLFTHIPHGICGSGDSFVQGITAVSCDMIDMEAYALAKICHRESIPFACIKYITDGADNHAALDWQTNLSRAAQAFVDVLNQHWPH